MKKITLLALLFVCFNSFSQVEIVTDFLWAYPTKVNNKIVFARSTPENGNELWVSDGTTAGTMLLRDINPGPTSSLPQFFTLLDDVVYFQANNDQIWRTDGTSTGTYLMVNNSQITKPFGFVKTQNFIFFTEGASGSSCCRTLWKMNVNANSESMVTPSENFITIRDLYVFNYSSDDIIFNAKTNANGWAIWRSNGGVSLLVKDLYTENNIDFIQIATGKKLGSDFYFAGFSTTSGSELWKTDATLPNTTLIKDIYVDANYFNGSNPANFIKVGATIYFTARDIANGIEVWKTDGSAIGTQMIKDVFPGNNSNSFSPSSLTEFNNQLYFIQNEGAGNQIWKTNGTAAGTIKLTNIPNASLPFSGLFVSNGILYFSLDKPDTGSELWKLDSNDAISMIQDIAPGTSSSGPTDFLELNGYIYFTATSNGFASGYKTYKIVDQNLSSESFINNKISIHPNPTSGIFNIQSEINSQLSTEVFDMIGKRVAQFDNQTVIDISNLNSGVYLLKITDKNTKLVATKKIVKQ